MVSGLVVGGLVNPRRCRSGRCRSRPVAARGWPMVAAGRRRGSDRAGRARTAATSPVPRWCSAAGRPGAWSTPTHTRPATEPASMIVTCRGVTSYSTPDLMPGVLGNAGCAPAPHPRDIQLRKSGSHVGQHDTDYPARSCGWSAHTPMGAGPTSRLSMLSGRRRRGRRRRCRWRAGRARRGLGRSASSCAGRRGRRLPGRRAAGRRRRGRR